ncbi:MAG: hypothetical protein CVU95_15460 [Firmicutes bacterium HGW-Firmicutes-2]|jgi:hypothetical protein|nr:MAG: hypothetical protein CVU95_15460 [Firmicutes bacterium HGW-Firmicutes-2]
MKKYGIYFLILIACIIIRIIPLSSGSNALDSVLNEIAIGGIASTVVALLIFYQEQKNSTRKKKIYRIIILQPFYRSMIRYMEQFCYKSAFMPKELRSTRKNFQEWSDYYCNKCGEVADNKTDGFYPISASEMLESVKPIFLEAENIQLNKVWLLKEDILSEEDLQTISKLNNIVYQYNLLCCTDDLLPHNVRIVNDEFVKKLSGISGFEKLLNFKFSYDVRLSNSVEIS